jgi:MYXO-CTERM domain-containing protein
MPANLQLSYDMPAGRQRVTIRFQQARTTGIPLEAYGLDVEPQSIYVRDRRGQPLAYAYETSYLGVKPVVEVDDTALAQPTGNVTPGTSRDYPEYEAMFLVDDAPGVHYLQLANAGSTVVSVYNLRVAITPAPPASGDGSCQCSTGADARMSWGMFAVGGAALGVMQRRRRGSRRRDP